MTMMAFGPYRFKLATAAYQRLARTASYRWPEQNRIGRQPAVQCVGPKLQTIALDGVIYPSFRGGLRQLDRMRTVAAWGTPMLLIAGTGRIYGSWVIEEVRETDTVFAANGQPRKIAFDLRLKQYGEDAVWV
jgi:phage protein U